MEIIQGSSSENIDIKLLDSVAPLTVANFRNYVSDGDYINSFIHRSDPGFVLQGGGFTFDPLINDGTFSNDPLINDFPGGLQPVPKDPPVINEFDRSNFRGTIAMAKFGLDPDSATSEWFFNLADNSSNLDNQNGGFTVFAEVLNGMPVIDAIAALPIFNRTDIHSAFGELPLLNYSVDPIEQANLVYINDIQELFTISPDIDYRVVASGTDLQSEVVIENISNSILTIGGIADINQLALPFSVDNDGCSFSVLQPGEICTITVTFSPESPGTYIDGFNVEFPDLGISYEVALEGAGGQELFTISPDIDYGTVTSGTNLQPEIVIENISNDILTIAGIADINQLALPFSIVNDSCSFSALQPGERCAFMVLFSPESPGTYTDSFNVEFPDIGISYEVMLNGEGGPIVPEADITLTYTSVDFGDVDVVYNDNSSYTFRQFITNFGDLPLTISGITLEGPSVDELSLSGDCLDVGALDPAALCVLDIVLAPITAGTKSATLTILTDDPDESPFVVTISGNAAAEDDGVPAFVEDAGLNGGDGNNDEIPDSQQSNVVSLVSTIGSYVTFITSTGLRIKNMSVSSQSEYKNLAGNINFNSGVYEFITEQVPSGGIIEVGLILPEDLAPDVFYVFGPTLENAEPHWYEFDFDGETGALIIGKASIQSPAGDAIVRNLVKFNIKDGGRGDTDLTVNGKISIAMGVSVVPITDGGGAVNIEFIIVLIFVLLIIRSRWHHILMNRLLRHRHVQNNFNS